MSKIELITRIHAPVERCFNLSRSIDLHLRSQANTGEQVIEGRTSGLIGMNETVTWRAKHFGLHRKLKVKITALDVPSFFEDTMLKGDFKFLQHRHYFIEQGEFTVMKDFFEFEAPFGFLGAIAEAVFLKRYLEKLLRSRNEHLRQIAETDEWRKFLCP